MKCAYHVDRDAVASCSQCQKPLCRECALPQGKNAFICTRCFALKAAEEVVQGTEQRLEAREEQREIRKAKKKKSTYLQVFIPLSAIVAMALLGLNFYFRASLPSTDATSQQDHPLVTLMLLDQALHDYAENHNGAFPHHLRELLGKYIPREDLDQNDLNAFIYKRTSIDAYELRARNADNEAVADVVFDEGGLR